jgi:DNA-binding NarL/FixJ family response regulator
MLVEDQNLARFTMGYFLTTSNDLELVGEAADGQAAIALAREQQPDVIVMDYFLPISNGAEATAQILKAAPDVRVIGISDNDSESVMNAMLDAGAVEFVPKRVPFPELLDTIRRVVQREAPPAADPAAEA